MPDISSKPQPKKTTRKTTSKASSKSPNTGQEACLVSMVLLLLLCFIVL